MGNFLWELKIQISGTTVVTKVHEFVLHLEKKNVKYHFTC